VLLNGGRSDKSKDSSNDLKCIRTFETRNRRTKCCLCSEIQPICPKCEEQRKIWDQVRNVIQRNEFVNAWQRDCREQIDFICAKELTDLTKPLEEDSSKTFKEDLRYLKIFADGNDNVSVIRQMIRIFRIMKAEMQENQGNVSFDKETFWSKYRSFYQISPLPDDKADQSTKPVEHVPELPLAPLGGKPLQIDKSPQPAEDVEPVQLLALPSSEQIQVDQTSEPEDAVAEQQVGSPTPMDPLGGLAPTCPKFSCSLPAY
jgi:hypothetical protein